MSIFGKLIVSERDREGYIEIDNRASGGKHIKLPVLSCCHCQKQLIRNPLRSRDRGRCFKCDRYICDSFACKFRCVPFEKLAEQILNNPAMARG